MIPAGPFLRRAELPPRAIGGLSSLYTNPIITLLRRSPVHQLPTYGHARFTLLFLRATLFCLRHSGPRQSNAEGHHLEKL